MADTIDSAACEKIKMTPPKVFVCHASEDKERFVLAFAERLRINGVDAWVDKWEMLPGDRLVRKIFEEGIKEAKTYIIVLSSHSVNKPWVKEEIDAAFVKRLEEDSRLIPVILDECEVPQCLKTTIWVRVNDISNYDAKFEEILHGIFEKREKPEKPALGPPPKYTESVIHSMPDLNELDTHVLKTACEISIEEGHEYIETEGVENRLKELGINEKTIEETLEVLDGRSYIKANRVIGPKYIPHFSITLFGFQEYAKIFIENYETLVEKVCFRIANEGEYPQINSYRISEELNIPPRVANHIFELLENNGLVTLSKEMGFNRTVLRVLPELRRRLK